MESTLGLLNHYEDILGLENLFVKILPLQTNNGDEWPASYFSDSWIWMTEYAIQRSPKNAFTIRWMRQHKKERLYVNVCMYFNTNIDCIIIGVIKFKNNLFKLIRKQPHATIHDLEKIKYVYRCYTAVNMCVNFFEFN